MDEALVRNARNGDPRAFAELVEGYYRFIYGVAFSTVGDWQAAEDIAQDTFLVAWVNLGKLRRLEAFGVWLRRIARNLARNWMRSNRYRQDLRQRREALCPESGAAECEALENLTRADARAQIWAALETLSPPLREVVVLYYLEENPIAQTAAMLGVTENSVKKRLQHARPKLRSYFEKQWKAELERERRRINRKEAGERFMAAVALGPVTGLAGKLGPGAGLWLHGEGAGRFASLLSVESAAVRTIAVALVVVAASAGGLLWNAHRQGPGAADPQPLPEVSGPAPHAASAGLAEAFPGAATAQKEAPESSAVEEPGAPIASPATAEETAKSVTVAGHVFDEEQQPIGGATVTVVASGLDIPGIESAGSFGGAGGMGSAGGFGGGVGGGIWGGGGGSFGGGGAVSAAGGGGFANTVGNPAFAPAGINETALLEALLDEARRFSVKSASDGSFSIADVPADGLMIISANAPGRCTHGTTISPASGAPTTDLVLTLSPGISIEGRALGARQQPVADGLIQVTALAWNQDGSAGGWGKSPEAWGWTRTDAQGRFALTVEAAGQATVLARSQTHGKAAFQNVRVEPGAFAELRFPAQSAVQGRIIDHHGGPAAGKTVRLTGHAGTMAEDEAHGTQAWGETTSGTWEATTDAAGAYRIGGVDPQLRYTACVFDGDGTALAPDLELDALVAGQTLVWDYTLPRPIVVKGVVIEQTSGKPATGAVVVCKAAGQAPEPPFTLDRPAAQAVTGPEGAFELRITTGPGKYDFGTDTATGFRSLSQRELREGESAVLNLTLPGTGSRSFLVIDEKGNPLQGVSVLIQAEGSDRAYGYLEQTGADGRIRVTGLPAGESVRCLFHCEGGEAESDAVANREAADSPEETIVIDTAK